MTDNQISQAELRALLEALDRADQRLFLAIGNLAEQIGLVQRQLRQAVQAIAGQVEDDS